MEPALELGRRSIAVSDLGEAEDFYANILCAVFGGRVDTRYMRTTEELLEKERRQRAPGAKRGGLAGEFTSTVSFTKVLVGRASIILRLYTQHVQEPPPEQLRGTPRLALQATSEQLAEVAELLGRYGLSYEGPVDHPDASPLARSLYFRDPSGNFIEVCCPRDGTG